MDVTTEAAVLARIPMPEVLDCERPYLAQLGEDGDPVDPRHVNELKTAFAETCEYGTRLWEQLDQLRGLLAERASHDAAYADLFAQVSSLLTGPRGDAGWSRDAARLLAREAGHEHTDS